MPHPRAFDQFKSVRQATGQIVPVALQLMPVPRLPGASRLDLSRHLGRELPD
jgi:hypothetical protein